MSRSTLIRLLILVLLAAAILAGFWLLPTHAWIADFRAWVESYGLWGLVLIAAFYIPATVLMIPGSPITLIAGFVYGVVPATIAISIGSTLGAALAFLVGR